MEIDIKNPECDVHEVWFQFYNYIAWKHEMWNEHATIFNIYELQSWIRQKIYNIGLKDTINTTNQFIEVWQTLGIIKYKHLGQYQHVTDKNTK